MATNSRLKNFIEALPKSETHLHLEGALPWDLLVNKNPKKFGEEPYFRKPFFRYDSFEELEEYCFKVAGTVGLLSSSIFRCEESIVKSYAIKLALSLQLINILRDINEDLNSGRFYFPQDELKKFNLTENDFKKKLKDETLKSFLSFQIKRIEDIFKESQALLPNSCKENQISSIIMGKIYIKILEKIKKNPLDALTKKVHISPLRKVMISISAFFFN